MIENAIKLGEARGSSNKFKNAWDYLNRLRMHPKGGDGETLQTDAAKIQSSLLAHLNFKSLVGKELKEKAKHDFCRNPPSGPSSEADAESYERVDELFSKGILTRRSLEWGLWECSDVEGRTPM